MPLVTLWQGDHRTLLFAAGLMNVCPPVLRYYAALQVRGFSVFSRVSLRFLAFPFTFLTAFAQGNYELVVVSNFLQGSSFGVLVSTRAILLLLVMRAYVIRHRRSGA